jgi:hypothetical protein
MKSSGLLVFMFVMMQSVVAQNLIERTVLGLSCQSTELPNRISEKVYSLKSKKTFNLFEFSKSNISKNKQEVSLKIGPKGLLKIKLERPTTLRIPIRGVAVITTKSAAGLKKPCDRFSFHTYTFCP